MGPWELLAGILARQHNVITTWQAEAVGVPRRALSHRTRHEGWIRFYRGVTGLPGPTSVLRRRMALVLAYARPTYGASRIVLDNPTDDETVIQAVVDAALDAGQALSGRSGAHLHGFARPPKREELWLPHQSGRLMRDDVRLRYGGPRAGVIQRIEGVPTLDPEGCMIEVARTPVGSFTERVDELVWLMARADSLRIASVDSLTVRFQSLDTCCGSEVLRQAVSLARGTLSHSVSESLARELAAEAVRPLGLEVGARPQKIMLNGRVVGEADIPIEAITLDLEVDGPHHRFLDQRLKDEGRDRLVRRALWEVERFPVELVRDHPQRFVARVREAAEARMRVLGL